RETTLRVHETGDHVAPTGAEHLDTRWNRFRRSADFDGRIRTIRPAHVADGAHDLGLGIPPGVQRQMRAELLRDSEPRRNRIDPDDDPSAASARDGDAVQAE